MKQLVMAVFVFLFAGSHIAAQNNQIPLIGSVAPEFSTNSTQGILSFPSDFGTSWKILFSHPADFTPVCTSELLELGHMQPRFEALGVKLAVISTDNVARHVQWVAYLEDLDYKNRERVVIDFPILEDVGAHISKEYGMLHEPTSISKDIRGVFIIDDKNVVRSVNFYPMQVGRNLEEIVRIVEALQTIDESHVFTPANWNDGDDVIVPYFPYTKAQVAADPSIMDRFYQVGNRMWFKKMNAESNE